MHARPIFVAALAAVALVSCSGRSTPPVPQYIGVPVGAGTARVVDTAPRFSSVGPYGLPGKVNAFAIDPNNSKIMYLGSGRGTALETYSSAGIYKTFDRGRKWIPIDNGLTDPQGVISSVVNALWLDPKNPSTLLAATEYDGLFRSTNGGASWSSIYRTTQATQIVAYNGALYATSFSGILTSSDQGKTWSVQLPASSTQYPRAFGANESTSGNAFFAGMSDGTIWSFASGKWSKVGTLPYTAHTGTDGSNPSVHQIAVNPLNPRIVYASNNDGLWDQALHASIDGGKTWNTVLNRQIYNYGLGAQAIAFSSVHPDRLYVGTDGSFFWIEGKGAAVPKHEGNGSRLNVIDIRDIRVAPNGKDDQCYLTSDQGLDYSRACSTPKARDSYLAGGWFTSLARRFIVSPDMKTILTSLQDWDSLYTQNGLQGWLFQNDGLYEDGFNELRPGDPSVCYAYDEAYGLRVSTDGCVHYAQPNGMQKSIFPSRLMTTAIAFDPKNPLQMYVVSGDIIGAGFTPAPRAVFGSTDGGTTLTQLPWKVSQPGAIWVDQTNGSHILVGGAKGGASSISVTFDGGKTWTASSGVPGTPFWYAITTSPVNGNVVLASSVDSANNVFVLRSANGGKTFTRVSTVVNAPLLRGRIDPDEEKSARPAFIYSPEREIRYNQDATTGKPAVAITTLRGAFISTNDGSTWTRLDKNLIAHSFWGIRWVNGYLYLGSDGQGVIKSTVPVQ